METRRSTETSPSATAPVPSSPSLRSRPALTAGRYGVRPINCLLPANPLGIAAARGLVASIMAICGPVLPGTCVTQVRSGSLRGEWVRAAGVGHGHRALYYVHGSGSVICSARTHRGLASRLSRATGLPVFVVDYRLAPEHPFPAAADDVAEGYRWLLARGCERRAAEAMACARTGLAAVRLYTGDEPEDSPRLRLRIPAGIALPPLFVQVSVAEMLANDAHHLRDLALMRWTGFSPDHVARITLDAHQRGRLHVLPQLDAVVVWHLERQFPATYTRALGVLNRFLPQADSTPASADSEKAGV
ncbi:alpha/beta hydrolase [Nocardia nova]|uniref:Alpha/beta hydrolase n=1 Tax=Nocardia nova TaxID=37330 RepID=A0A2S6AU60_9NOCA|nr:alpha/beta hydrolase fold domain-containing protein [Nocardia nova]PPJ30915.1 alpha/beta hydrolase [Nocardia nova]PPJ38729.1 alpha/beta hydrolase [Nocardia nova]